MYAIRSYYEGGADATSVREVIDWGSRNGAELLGLNSGRIAVGAAADLGIRNNFV